MTDRKKTTATLWEDQHAGKRGHQLMTQKLADTIPAIYANEKVSDYDTVLAHAKLFSPYSNWTWYITEIDAATGQCFGLVDGLEREIGYFDLTELAETTVYGGVPAVERDLYWEPKTLGEIKRGSQEDSPHGDDAGKGDTMTDETGADTHPSDVVSAEEFLFGGVTEEKADDYPDEVADEFPAGDATDDAGYLGDVETAEGPDADTGTIEEPDAAEESDAPGARAERPAMGESEDTDELKVVLSIRGNRATIGVQRPSADPHIESFDDPDLFGLADEFPAVVARARARWEEEPRHPAYVKPAPQPRQRNRCQQAAAQAATAEGEIEEDQQPQPETLRLF